MDACLNKPRVFRAAAVAMMGLAMICGLLILFSGIALPVSAAPLAATVVITEDITVDATWTTGNVYIVSTDTVAVRDGAKLTIEPGVEVRFSSDANMEIRTSGSLEAIGTPANPITFTAQSATPDRGFWDGISFNTNAEDSTIQYAVIEYADWGVAINQVNRHFDVSSNTIRYIGDYDGDPDDSGAIIGAPDGSDFNFNTIYSAEVGIRLNKAFGNDFYGNHIYDVDGYCIGLVQGSESTGGGNNQFVSNQLHDCGSNGLRLEGGGVSGNQIINNVITNTASEGIYGTEQSGLILNGNTLFDTAISTASGYGGVGTDQAALALIDVQTPIILNNYLHDNGGTGGAYQGAAYVVISGTLTSLVVRDNRVLDDVGSGVILAGDTPISQIFDSNALCVTNPPYELENRTTGLLTAEGNWFGTNLPLLGTHVNGNVDFDPWIQLSIARSPTILPADGLSTSVITITMNDGGTPLHTMPPGARTINLSTSLGTLSSNQVTLNAGGVATVTLQAPVTAGTAVVTATELCDYFVTTSVEFQMADVGIGKTSAITQAIPGQTITYTIPFSNDADVPATNVVITDDLPAGTVWLSDNADTFGFTRVQTSPDVVWTHPSLGPHASGTITLVAQVQPSAGCNQTLTNDVVITSAATDEDPGNNSASHSGISTICADVAISKIGPGGTVVPGQTITYTISYSNVGTAPATGVVITDVNPVTGGVDTLLSGVTLNPGQGGSLDYVVTADTSICGRATLTNTAYIETDTPESDTSNNVAISTNSPQVQCLDLVITKTVASVAPSFGKVTTFTVEYQNTGAYTAPNVVITDFLDSNVQYVTDTLGIPPTTTPTTVRWGLGDVGPGDSGSFEVGLQPVLCIGDSVSFTNAVRIEASLPDQDDSNNYDQAGPVIIPCNNVDLVVVKNDGVGGPSQRPFVLAGDLITYTISYNNVGGADASGVVLTETLPAYTTFVGPTGANGWFQVGATTAYTYWIGNLPSMGGGVVPFVVRVVPDLPATVTVVNNTVEIGGDEPDADPDDNTSHEQTPVQPAPDIAVEKIALTPVAHPGDLVTYVITVTNQGSLTSTNVVITDTLPPGTTYASDTLGGHSGSGSGPITWSVGQLTPGQTLSFELTVLANTGICSYTYLINTVEAYGAEPEGDYTNNVATTTSSTSPAVACRDVAIIKSVDPPQTGPDHDVVFTLIYSNPGLETMNSVVVTDALPSGISFVSSTPPGFGPVGGEYSWDIGDLAPGVTGTIVITGHVAASVPCDTSLTNRAGVTTTSDDQYLPNNYATATVQVICGVDLVVVKNDGVGTPPFERPFVQPGELITYTISYNNIGTGPATNVVLTETLPNYTTFVRPLGWTGGPTTYTYIVGTVNPGSGGVVPFVVRVDDPLPMSVDYITNTVCIGGDQSDIVPGDNCSYEQTPVGRNQPRLNVTKSAIPPSGSTVARGSTITYTVVVLNDGGATANNILITDTLPLAEVSFVTATLSTGGPIGGPNPLTASVPTLGVNSAVTMTVVVTVNNVPDGTVITNTAQAIADTLPLQSSLPVTHVVGVVTGPQLTAAKSAVANPSAGGYVLRGSLITYTISVQNVSTTTQATGVMITDYLPISTTFVSSSTTRGTVSGPDPLVVDVGTLGTGDSVDFNFTVQVMNTAPLGLVITNVGLVDSDQTALFNTNVVTYVVTDTLPSFQVFLPIILKNYPEEGPSTPTPIPVSLAWVSDVAVDPTTNQIFVASPRQDAVHVVDGEPDEYDQSVPVGHGPTGLAVLTSTTPSKVFAVHAYAYNDWTPGVWIIDISTLSPHAMTHYGGYVGAAPVKAAANPNPGWERAYISNYFDHLPIVYGPTEYRIGWVPKKSFQASYGIDINLTTNMIYMASIDTGELVIFDGYWAEMGGDYGPCHHAPPEPRSLRMVAVNEATGHVFVTSPPDTNKGQTSSKVFVLDEDTLLENTGGPPSDQTCLWNFGLSTDDVGTTAIPGPAWIATVDLPGAISAGEEGVAANPLTGRVYVTDGPGDQLFVIQDSITPTNISLVTTVAVDDNPQGVDVNPQTNKIYVANAHHVGAPYGTVSVVDGATNVVTKTIVLGP